MPELHRQQEPERQLAQRADAGRDGSGGDAAADADVAPAQQQPERRLRPRRVPARRDDDDLARADAADVVQRVVGVPDRRPRVRVDDELARRARSRRPPSARPPSAFPARAPSRRARRRRPSVLSSAARASRAAQIGMERVRGRRPSSRGRRRPAAAAALTSRRRRSQRKKSSVPITVSTSLTRLLPLQLRLAARALAHVDGDLLDPQALRLQPQQRLHLGRAAHVRLGHHGHRLRVDRGHPARRVVEAAPEPDVHRLLQQADPEAPARRRAGSARRRSPRPRRSASRRRRRRRPSGRARAGGRARPPDAGRRRRRGRRTRSRARPPRGSRRRSRRAGRGSRRRRRRSRRGSRATSAVASVEPSSITSTSASGSTAASSSRTAGRFASSFQAGMKTTVSGAGAMRPEPVPRDSIACRVSVAPTASVSKGDSSAGNRREVRCDLRPRRGGLGCRAARDRVHVHRGADLASRPSRFSTSPTCRRTSAAR